MTTFHLQEGDQNMPKLKITISNVDDEVQSEFTISSESPAFRGPHGEIAMMDEVKERLEYFYIEAGA